MAPTYDDIYLFWGPRPDSIRVCAERYARWLRDLGEIEPLFASWFQQGWSRREALKRPLAGTPDHIETLLAKRPTIRRENQGWAGTFWAPGPMEWGEWSGAQVDVRCGEGSPYVLNRTHLALPQAGPASERVATRDVMLRIFQCSIRAWEPHDGYVRSTEYANTLGPLAPDVIRGGWMVYFSREAGRIPPLPTPAEIIPVDDLGSIIVFTPEPFRGGDPEHVAWANHLVKLLSRAGLKVVTTPVVQRNP
jgi:hypothetical protein